MRQQRRREQQSLDCEPPGSLGLLQGFVARTHSQPDAPAIIFDGRTWTYTETAERARIIAASIVEACDGRAARIGILAGKTFVSYVAVLASLMAGAAFVPINPKYPAKLRKHIIDGAQLDAIIIGDDCIAELADTLAELESTPLLLFPETTGGQNTKCPELDARDIAAAKPLEDYPLIGKDDIAYLLFTSGSTGTPKGVPVSHGNICAFLNAVHSRYVLDSRDRFTQNFELSFDLALFDLFVAWQSGGAVCVPTDAEKLSPFDFLRRNGVTIWFSVPSQAMMLLEHDMLAASSMPTLRLSLFCGEPLPVSLAAAWQAAAPNSIVENLYGPTELTLACMAYRWRGEESLGECLQHLLPIGHPFPGLETIVVNGELEDVPEGTVGELCVAGPQTFAGYWQDSDASRNAFLFRHAADGTLLRFYRTGDLVTRRNTVFSFCGREDGRVKIHGYRIELGQIEGEMRAAGYGEAIALAWPDTQQPRSILLVVYGGRDPDRVLADARSRLPAYMIPAHVVGVDEIPTNVNGKVDRTALINRVQEIMASRAEAPAHETADELDLMIAEALAIAPVRLSDELSLNSTSKWDSLGHAQLMMALEAFTGREISSAMTGELTSVRAIRRFVGSSDSGDQPGRSAEADEPIHRGLAGLVVERSAVSRVDGSSGTLEYSGYNIDELCGQSSFEEVLWLLLNGELPNANELGRFSSDLAGYRAPPAHIFGILEAMVDAPPSVALRTAVSALAASPEFASSSLETGLRIVALFPVIIATHHAVRSKSKLPSADPSLSHAANFAQMLFGSQASPQTARFIEQDLILHADHEANASTFTTRVVIGCEAGLTGAVTAAIAAFLGELHGGAVEVAGRMFDEIGEPSNAAEYVRDHKRVMGFGHRVYRVEDPRVRHTRAIALSHSEASGDMRCLRIADALVEAMGPRAKFGIAPNVDLYAAVAYRALGIADDLGTVLGAAGRVAGWVAHAMEQQRDNVLVRPRLKYVGAQSRNYPLS